MVYMRILLTSLPDNAAGPSMPVGISAQTHAAIEKVARGMGMLK